MGFMGDGFYGVENTDAESVAWDNKDLECSEWRTALFIEFGGDRTLVHTMARVWK